MMTKTKVMLDNFYRSDTEKLSRLLNDDQYLWKGAGNDRGIVGDSTTQPNNTEDTFSYGTNKLKRANQVYRLIRYMCLSISVYD